MEPRDPDEDVRRISAPAISGGDATGWFDQLYAEAAKGQAVVPWDRGAPHPLLVEWLERHRHGVAKRTLVVGSGFGEDAAYLARQGFGVIGFDISAAAVRAARLRFPSVPVDFRVADLLNPPAEWHQHFDLVVESYTIQALPVRLRRTAVTHETRFVRPGGTLLVLAAGRDAADDDLPGPPWPLTRSDVESFATEGLVEIEIEELREPPDVHRWRAEFRRPATDGAAAAPPKSR